jgi:hypothetical protein
MFSDKNKRQYAPDIVFFQMGYVIKGQAEISMEVSENTAWDLVN